MSWDGYDINVVQIFNLQSCPGWVTKQKFTPSQFKLGAIPYQPLKKV
jgi:hypothetical protein